MLCRTAPCATLGWPTSQCGPARVQLGGVRRGRHAAPLISERAVVRVFAQQGRPSGGPAPEPLPQVPNAEHLAAPTAPEATADHVNPSNSAAVPKPVEASFVPVAAPLLTTPASAQPAASFLGNQTMMLGLLVLQAVALVGATVTGTLARTRRQEVERINDTLRQINMKLRDPVEKSIPSEQDMQENYRKSLEESFGEQTSSTIHRSMDETHQREERERLRDQIALGRKLKEDGRYEEALEALQVALIHSKDLEQLSATRAILRIKAAVFREMELFKEALQCLMRVLAVSMAKEEFSGDADVFGEIADLYAELGDLEQSGEYYDRYLKAIESGLPSNLTSTWDMV